MAQRPPANGQARSKVGSSVCTVVDMSGLRFVPQDNALRERLRVRTDSRQVAFPSFRGDVPGGWNKACSPSRHSAHQECSSCPSTCLPGWPPRCSRAGVLCRAIPRATRRSRRNPSPLHRPRRTPCVEGRDRRDPAFAQHARDRHTRLPVCAACSSAWTRCRARPPTAWATCPTPASDPGRQTGAHMNCA